jgi:hypothetical protein
MEDADKRRIEEALQELNRSFGVGVNTLQLDEGPASLSLPPKLSAESVGDIEHWLEGILLRLRRNVGAAASR